MAKSLFPGATRRASGRPQKGGAVQGRANARRSASGALPLRCGASVAGLGRASVPGEKAPFFLVNAEHKAFWDGEDRPFS